MNVSDFPITIIIIAVTVIYSLKGFKDANFQYKWMFYPYRVHKNDEHYRFLTHMFIHGDQMHLFFNMFVLFSFGRMMEMILTFEYGTLLGSAYFIMLYFLGGLAAGLWPLARNLDNSHYMSLGASGAVSAVLFASILWLPQGGIYLMFIPYEIPAWLFGILYLGFEFYMSKRGDTRVAHDAHFGGAVFGIVFILIINFSKASEFINHVFS